MASSPTLALCAVRFLATVAFVAIPLAAGADEGTDNGISLSAWAGAAMDRSVTHVVGGQPLHDGAALAGVTALGNVGPLAIGAAFDGTPGIFGDGRMSVAGLAGWQPRVGGLRLQILGEAGGHRFTEVGAGFFDYQIGGPTWLPYGGVRLGAARTFPEGGHFDVGMWMFARYDFGRETVTTVSSGILGSPSTSTDYRVGGFMGGLALQIGLRLETPRPPATTVAAR